MSTRTLMASLADRALLIWPIKDMAIGLDGALSFLVPSRPGGAELLALGGGEAEKDTARPTSERRTIRRHHCLVLIIAYAFKIRPGNNGGDAIVAMCGPMCNCSLLAAALAPARCAD